MRPSKSPLVYPLAPVEKAAPAQSWSAFFEGRAELVGRPPKFPRYGRLPRGLAAPGSTLQQLHDVAGEGSFIPPGW